MAALTYVELQDEALFNSFDAIKMRPRIKRWLNDAVNEVCRRTGLLRLHEVAAYDSTGSVSLQTRFTELLSVHEADGPVTTLPDLVANQSRSKLAPLPYNSGAFSQSGYGSCLYYAVQHEPSSTGPAVRLRLYPHLASGFVAVVGRGTPAPMSLDADTSGLGVEFDDLLVTFARSRSFRAEDDFEAARELMADFDRGIRYVSLARPGHRDGPQVTPGMWEDTDPSSGGW